MLCFVPREEPKTISAHRLYVIIQSNPWNIGFKGAIKLYFMHCLRVVIILVSTGLYKSAFSTYFFFWKTRFSSFCVLVFHVSKIFGFYLFFFVLCFEFNVILNNVRHNNILWFFSHFIQVLIYKFRWCFKKLSVFIPRKRKIKNHQKYSLCCHSRDISSL